MKSQSEKAVVRVVIATGISSIVTQLYTIREFLAGFAGNEFVIALIIFSWLVLSGSGTLLARTVLRFRTTGDRTVLGQLTICLSMLSVVQILAIRSLRDIAFIHGSSVGFYATFAYIFFSICPYTLLLGFVLPYSLFVIRVSNADYPGTRIYIADNIGDVTGGALFSFALVYMLTPMKALFAVNLMLLLAAWPLFPSGRRLRLGCCALMVLAVCANLAGIFVERRSLAMGEGELVHYEESFFGRIVILQDNHQYTLYEDGVPVFGSGNFVMAEEAVHYPLSQIDNPRDVLIISSVAGMMEELNKYDLDAVDYVQLDPAVSIAEFRFNLLKRIRGLHVVNSDGRAYVRDTGSMYDAIIIALPEPETFQVNRFFTGEFFELVRERLRPRGVLSFSVEGFDNYLAESQRQKISSLYNTVKRIFPQVLVFPGGKIVFVCSNSPLSTDIPGLLRLRGISTRYINGYFYGNVTRERISSLMDSIDASAPVNMDMSPHMMQIMYEQWFAKYGSSPRIFILFVCVLACGYLLFITREEFVLFTTGATTMGAEILIIFIFQILYGYIYLKIGLIVTVFLAGLLPGAFFGQRVQNKTPGVLIMTDGGIVVLMALIIAVLSFGGGGVPQWTLYAFALGVSVLCGFQFPIALSLRGGDNTAAVRTFSADLMGAAAGVLIMSVFLIPYLGIIRSTAGLIVLKCASIMMVRVGHGKDQQAFIPAQ